MSLLNQVKSFARSPAGRETMGRFAAGRTSGSRARGRSGRRASAPAAGGLGGIVRRIAGGMGGRRHR